MVADGCGLALTCSNLIFLDHGGVVVEVYRAVVLVDGRREAC